MEEDGANIRQLHLCYVASLVEGIDVLPEPPRKLLEAAARIYERDEMMESSEGHKAVSTLLREELAGGGGRVRDEVDAFAEYHGYSLLAVDIVIDDLPDGRMIAIEFDGPTHYSTNVETGDKIPNGKKRLKR